MGAPDADDRVLQEDVREGLLRGVRADVALRNFGRCFSTPEGSLASMTEGDLAMSVVTKKLDDFISHDWQTRRWQKLLALCVIFNGDAAVVGSCAVALLVTALENRPIAALPKLSETPGIPDQASVEVQVHTAPWGFLCSTVTFWVLLLFGQRIRAVARRGRMVFLDRLCINQSDEEEKCEGIASIAGFMRHSDRLVVLWSPRYFTRLWCVYEMATWLHLGRSLHSSMAFMPVGFAVGLVVLNVNNFFFLLFALIDSQMSTGTLPVGSILGLLLSAWQVHTLRCLEGELGQLVNQLEQFSISNADCWCCSQAHTHPVSGDRLLCDRALVHRTLHAWRGNVGGVSDALEQFDLMVRTTFKDAVSAAFGVVRINYRQALMVAAPVAWAFPELCSSVDRVEDPLRGLQYLVGWFVIVLCAFPVTLKATLAAAILSVRACPPRRSRLLDAALAVGISLFPPLVGGAQLFAIFWAITNRSGAPQLGVLLAEAALTALCFCRPPRCRSGPTHGPAPRCRDEENPTVAVTVERRQDMDLN